MCHRAAGYDGVFLTWIAATTCHVLLHAPATCLHYLFLVHASGNLWMLRHNYLTQYSNTAPPVDDVQHLRVQKTGQYPYNCIWDSPTSQDSEEAKPPHGLQAFCPSSRTPAVPYCLPRSRPFQFWAKLDDSPTARINVDSFSATQYGGFFGLLTLTRGGFSATAKGTANPP
ncbi:hypothetical protein CABS01_04416 [Colletotrichum abscissum]|uniref:Uncharacterized protein n=2 Tax=Colletotrichum acutatum species complex TaxID=2707335 RepID=A0A9Q0B5W6_9PEZI|nr:uncharacterized protein CLUP02_05594 [Colletotrichum lupini]XP_060390632.1 uncharacterized protein CABS01_04416 [Colletotrichum abscissum]KAI3556280.1 hypothetical protein CABS02_03563 [Colletotrichum abscissum]KAK1473754.1 hypothetical protein CABS01_04416 [Colletotrichum abscissum]UQC80112.1 hypothetical protein CLUP02_05594 [Colletotrichum lupini]